MNESKSWQLLPGVNFTDNQQKTLYLNEILKIGKSSIVEPEIKIRFAAKSIDSGDIDVAESILVSTLKFDSRNEDARELLAQIEERRGIDRLSALISFREEIRKLDPWNIDNLASLAAAYKISGNLQKVEAIKVEIRKFGSNHQNVVDLLNQLEK